MARLGKQPVIIPNGAEVKVNGRTVMVKGPKGEVAKELPRGVEVEVKGAEVFVEQGKLRDKKHMNTLQGTFRAHVNNMVLGVTDGWKKELEINGAGYRASVSGNKLTMMIGYSHPVEMEIPDGVTVNVEKNVVSVTGADKEAVGQFAANIRAKREPEPYKGSGIKYVDEVIRRKAGKQASTAGAA